MNDRSTPSTPPSGGSTLRGGGRAGRAVAVGLFAGWTLFVWGGRLRNLLVDTGGFGAASRWSAVGAIAFTVIGLALAVVWLTGRFRARPSIVGSAPVERVLVVGLAALTAVVWLIRGVDIALGDHPVGFIAVHIVLAAVSIALAGVAAKRVRGAVGPETVSPVGSAQVSGSEPGRSTVG